MKRMLLIVLAVLLSLILAVGAYLYFNLNGLIQSGIERYGPRITGTSVTLESCSVSVFSGSGELNGLFIGNPQGFATDRAMSFGLIGMSLDTGTVTDETVIVHTIDIEDPWVTLEISSDGSNLQTLQQNVEANTASEESAPSDPDSEKKIFIKDIWIKGTQVTVAITELDGRSITVSIPPLHLTDIGQDDSGVAVSQAVDQILSAWYAQIVAAVSLDLSFQELLDEAGILLEDAQELLMEGIDDLSALPADALDHLPNADDLIPETPDVLPETPDVLPETPDILPEAPDVGNPLRSIF